MTPDTIKELKRIADDIQETYRYQGGQEYARRIRAILDREKRAPPTPATVTGVGG